MRLQADRTNVAIFECFSSESRLRIIELLNERPMNIKELADAVGLSSAIVTKHVQKMEEAGLLVTESIAGKRGMQKLCRLALDELTLVLKRGPAAGERPASANRYEVSLPVGQYSSCAVKPTCGLASEHGMIGMVDDPRYFSDPEHVKASHLWFGSGFVEYRIPNYLLRNQTALSLDISLEICSEAPGFNENWPSDISFYVNDRLLGTWTCPGDFGETRGVYTPEWWINRSQYGLLKTLSVGPTGAYIDGVRLSDVTLDALGLAYGETISFRIAALETARNVGGVTLFGKGFGNYNQDIHVSLTYA
ncbi:ArsR family transcriptional regulator [Paenibacillus antri]|uniref:ArsR family transcriptional regulator n=1 Tax=Paenibacillus antri TaxID=2582848 RepID=A0A5R9G2I6_9BACL|nr:ArsR family transcriptional regulator [Paenibacillus antri]TLS49239.1 ArsR family transcriptional regulator [Paenibacillus antri]